jgi:hypothetical protein
MTDWGRRLGTAATDALGLTLSVPRAAASGIDWLGRRVGVDIGADPALASVQQPGGGQLFPDAPTAKEMAFQTTGATEYQPATMGGRMLQSGLTAAATLPFGGGGVRALVPSLVGGGTGEAAAELFPEHPWLASVLGFLVGSRTTSGVTNAATRQVGMRTGLAEPSELYKSYERSGVPITTDANAAETAWQTAAENAAKKLGPSATPTEAGVGLQAAAQNWLQDFRQTADGKWNAFRGQVPSATQIPVAGFQKALQGVTSDFGGADALAKALQPGLAAKLQDALRQDISPNGTLPWQAVQSTRSALGELMASGQPIADTTQAAIKRLYAGLSDDMRSGASAAGPTASAAFNDASGYTANGHALLDAHLKPILNATNPETAAQYAMAQARQGGSRLGAINMATSGPNFSTPGAGADLGAMTIRQAAENGPDALARKIRTMSPEAQHQLFGDPATRQAVDDLYKVANSLKETGTKYAPRPPSDTGRIVGAMEGYQLGQELTGSHWGGLAGAGVGLAAPSALSAGPRLMAGNQLLEHIYNPQVAPFSVPSRINTLYLGPQAGQEQAGPAVNGMPRR